MALMFHNLQGGIGRHYILLEWGHTNAEKARNHTIRPISLIGSIYKILAKVLANRLQMILSDIISANQSAFVDGRQILDSVITDHECLDSRYKQHVPGFVRKLDFKKADDRVDSNFLIYMMKWMGFGEKWCWWIFNCVSSTRFPVLVNGSPKGFFRSSRGLRQGDPLSPMLFVLVVEALHVLLYKAKQLQILASFSIDRKSVMVNHL